VPRSSPTRSSKTRRNGFTRRRRPVSGGVGVVVFPAATAKWTASSPSAIWGARDAYSGTVTRTSWRRRGDCSRRVRTRRLPPARCHSQVLAGDAPPCPVSPPTGVPVVGICNGFQVLTEAGLLPGALQKNRGLKFLCQPSMVRVETSDSSLTSPRINR
jgi:hypothetical protein